jgi:hypothetical protein
MKINKAIISMALLFSFLLSACGDTTYVVNTTFFYSSDNGATYGNRTKKYYTGENIYLLLIMKVDTNKSEQIEVPVKLYVPFSTHVNATFFDGPPITPKVDSINSRLIYEFSIIASNDSREWEVGFQFIANSSTNLTLSVEYGDMISSIFDSQNTISFDSLVSSSSSLLLLD